MREAEEEEARHQRLGPVKGKNDPPKVQKRKGQRGLSPERWSGHPWVCAEGSGVKGTSTSPSNVQLHHHVVPLELGSLGSLLTATPRARGRPLGTLTEAAFVGGGD